MALAFALVAAAMLLAANVNAQCPTCDANNGAQTVCVVDTTTNALQQFISLCEMDLFNCQNNQNVFQPLYYGDCQASTNTVAQPVYTQPVYTQPVYTQTVYTQGTNAYPASAGGNYYTTGGAAAQPNLALSGTDPNGDWSVRLISSINPAALANRGTYQTSTAGNAYTFIQRNSAGSTLPIGTKTLASGGTTTGFVPSSGNNGYTAGSTYNFAQRSGVGGGYAAVGSKTGVVANRVTSNTVQSVPNTKVGGMTVPVVRNQVPVNVGAKPTWASNKGSMGTPIVGRFPPASKRG